MDFLSTEQIQGKNLDHLSLIAVTQKNQVQLKKQIVNLGFIDNRLYVFPDFLSSKPVEKLLGKRMKPEYFNDDTLGRSLDEIYDYGTTKLFSA